MPASGDPSLGHTYGPYRAPNCAQDLRSEKRAHFWPLGERHIPSSPSKAQSDTAAKLSPRRAATLAAALLVASCGGSDGATDDGDNSALKFQGESRAAAQVVEDFGTAIRGKDWKRICNELYSADERDLQKGLLEDSCEEGVDRYADLDNLELTVTSATIERKADVTTTTAAGGEASFDLQKEGGTWLIDGTSGDFTAAEGAEPSGDTPSGTGDEAAAAKVVLDFDQAIADEDWATVCSLYSENRRDDGFDGCPAQAEEDYGLGPLGLSVSTVELETKATVSTRTGKGDAATFTLVPEGGRWRIDGYGGTFGD